MSTVGGRNSTDSHTEPIQEQDWTKLVFHYGLSVTKRLGTKEVDFLFRSSDNTISTLLLVFLKHPYRFVGPRNPPSVIGLYSLRRLCQYTQIYIHSIVCRSLYLNENCVNHGFSVRIFLQGNILRTNRLVNWVLLRCFNFSLVLCKVMFNRRRFQFQFINQVSWSDYFTFLTFTYFFDQRKSSQRRRELEFVSVRDTHNKRRGPKAIDPSSKRPLVICGVPHTSVCVLTLFLDVSLFLHFDTF